jgi:hypothetical protein
VRDDCLKKSPNVGNWAGGLPRSGLRWVYRNNVTQRGPLRQESDSSMGNLNPDPPTRDVAASSEPHLTKDPTSSLPGYVYALTTGGLIGVYVWSPAPGPAPPRYHKLLAPVKVNQTPFARVSANLFRNSAVIPQRNGSHMGIRKRGLEYCQAPKYTATASPVGPSMKPIR